MLLGFSVAGRSALAVLLVGIFAVIARSLGALEESHLQRTFGERYERYRASTSAVIGRPSRAGRPPPARQAASQGDDR